MFYGSKWIFPVVLLGALLSLEGYAQQPGVQSRQQGAANPVEIQAAHQPRRPFPELPPEEAQYLDQFLDYWETTSQQVKQYVCEFRRFEYDSETVNYRDPGTNRLAAARIATGEIKYSGPDKGFYQTTQVWDFQAPPQQPGGEAQYKLLETENSKEKWICDGRNIYEFDFQNKRLYETEIPGDMRGERIIDSPLPFLFGAKKNQILARYWVRVVPQENPDEYWLEAWPKRAEDARLYSRIEIILAKKDFLPKAMHMYSPQYDPKKGNFQSRYFAFENRQINDRLNGIQDFLNIFIRPQTPILGGWKRVDRSALYEKQAALPIEQK